MTWLVSWAAEVICRYRIQANGRTSYDNVTGHKGLQRIAIFGEKVIVRFTPDKNNRKKMESDWSYGYFLGVNPGNPVATVSKKLPHVGLSAFHNEYMALRYATAHAVWLRQLLQETGWGFAVTEPTPLMGDNIAANQLVAEDFITTRNQYL